ncbi:hypothetical protein MHU86_13098 [Fragilaria crotonensis]|nr:hypothetical protein MHU86_13098 [Fragilaria crotonensis]
MTQTTSQNASSSTPQLSVSQNHGESNLGMNVGGQCQPANNNVQMQTFHTSQGMAFQSMQNVMAQQQQLLQQQQQRHQQLQQQQHQQQLQYHFYQQQQLQQQQQQPQQPMVMPVQYVQVQQFVPVPMPHQNQIHQQPQQAQSVETFQNAQEPIQAQYNAMWTHQSQGNPNMLSYYSPNDHAEKNQPQYCQQQMPYQVSSNSTWTNEMHPAPVSSLGTEVCDTFKTSTTVNMPRTGFVSEMRSVTSQGMLLPLVQMPDTQKSKTEENPKQKMKECMDTIEEALQDPTLADAGKVLLQAMQASSTYMSGLLESRRSRDSAVLFPELPCSKSASADTVPSNRLENQVPIQAPQQDPAPVSPVLSARHSPADDPKSSQVPKTKPVVHKASCGRVEKKPKPIITSSANADVSPHRYLTDMLRNRGYSTERISCEEGGYHTDPTPLQLASFGTHLVQAVNNCDTETISKLLGCGLSPNPCNQFGDAILSLICKRADYSVFSVFLEHGCDLRVCDSFGRTALHHLAWAGKFSDQMARGILERDPIQVLMEDKQGKCPMECVRRDQWPAWIEFLKENMDSFWPESKAAEAMMIVIPRSGPVADPLSALSPSLAQQVAAGSVSPEDAVQMKCRPSSPPKISLDFSLF